MLGSFGVAHRCLRKPNINCAGQETTGCILTAAALRAASPSAGALTATAVQEPVWWDGARVRRRAQGLAAHVEGDRQQPPTPGSAVPVLGILRYIFSGWGNRETQIK